MSDIHATRLTFIERLRVRLGRCPVCKGELEDAVLDDLVESWEYHSPKYIARTLGNRGAPAMHNEDIPRSRYCPKCHKWYAGRWSYRES